MIEILSAHASPNESAHDIHLIGHDALCNNQAITGLALKDNTTAQAIAENYYNPNDSAAIAATRDQLAQTRKSKPEFMIAYANKEPVGFIQTKYDPAREDGARIATVEIAGLFVRERFMHLGYATRLAYTALAHYNQELPLKYTTAYWNLAMRGWGENYYFDGGLKPDRTIELELKLVKYVAESVGIARQNMRHKKPYIAS